MGYVPEPVVMENIPTIAEHGARGGAATIPGVGCGARCADSWIREHRPIPNQPSSEALHRELRTLRSSALKVLPKLRLLARVSLAGTTAYLLWKIGSGEGAKLLKIGVPPATDAPQYHRWDSIAWRNALSQQYAGGRYPTREGWVISLRQTCLFRLEGRMTDQERQRIEHRCLAETKVALTWLTPDDPVRVHEVKLEGSYPDTKIVVTGEHTYGGNWRVRFPIWDPGAGGIAPGGPMPTFIGTLVYTEVLEARSR